jgi:ribosomal protein L29
MNNEKKELKNLTVQELILKVEGYKRDLFTLRLNSKTAHVKDYSQFAKTRRNLARVLTYLRQK